MSESSADSPRPSGATEHTLPVPQASPPATLPRAPHPGLALNAPLRPVAPGIVQIHEIGEQKGLPYFSLEFVEGGSLSKRLDNTPQPPRWCATLAGKLARAIHAAHQQGIIHSPRPETRQLAACGG